jgi:hypothetical protein
LAPKPETLWGTPYGLKKLYDNFLKLTVKILVRFSAFWQQLQTHHRVAGVDNYAPASANDARGGGNGHLSRNGRHLNS